MMMLKRMTTAEPRLLSLGGCTKPGVYEDIHSRFSSVLNFIMGDRIVSLCDASHAPGPFRIITTGLSLEEITAVELSDDLLRLNASLLPVIVSDIYQPPVFTEPTDTDLLQRNLCLSSKYLSQHASSDSLPVLLSDPASAPLCFQGQLAQSLRTGLDLFSLGKYREGTNAMKRRGMGLTPAGDDLLIGFLIGCSWLEVTRKKQLSKIRECVYFAALDNDLMVNTFLYQGYALLVDEDWVDFLLDLSRSEIFSYRSMDRLMGHGASSGADQLLGFHQAVKLFGI